MMASSWYEINTYRLSSSNPRLGTLTGSFYASVDNVRITKVVRLGSITVNGRQTELFDLFTAEGKFVTTDPNGVCNLTSGQLPFCA
jgi:hypothetical protein